MKNRKISISIITLIVIALMGTMLAGCTKPAENNTTEPAVPATIASEAPATEAAEEGFKYEHDPKLSELVMRDCIVNPEAVYGFSPSPESASLGEYAEYDWTDPDFVEGAKAERIKYHEELASMMDMVREMRTQGKSEEEVARAVSAERNRIRLDSCKDDPEKLEKVKASNLAKYGDENGPSADSLYESKGSWEAVLQGAFSPNLGMDACCGLYDMYYQDYIELGLVETGKK